MWLGPLLLLGLTWAPATGEGGDPYRRIVSKALGRAQTALLDSTRIAVDHSRWEDPWIVTTEHYEVRATKSYIQTRRLADDLESMRSEFVRLLGEGSAAPMGKSKVWIISGMPNYNRFGEQIGDDHSSLLGSFYSTQDAELPVVALQHESMLWLWVMHSATHQFLQQSFGPQRHVWIDEGLASYFSLLWNLGWAAQRLEQIERGPAYTSLQRLVRDPLQAYPNPPDDRFIQLGMLFHYLLTFCDATRNGATGDPDTGPFQEFLRAAVRGQDVSGFEFMQTFEEAAQLLEEDFKSFEFQ